MGFFAPTELVGTLRRTVSWSVRAGAPREASRDDTMWLPLGYHPVLRWGHVQRNLTKFLRDPFHAQLFNVAFGTPLCHKPGIRLAYRNVLPYAVHLVQKKGGKIV